MHRRCVAIEVFNLGNNEPVELMRYIQAIELASGKKP